MDTTLKAVNLSDAGRCNVNKLPVPSFFPHPNGQSFDNCTDSTQCKASLKCMTIGSAGFELRTCKTAENFPQSCANGANAPMEKFAQFLIYENQIAFVCRQVNCKNTNEVVF